MSLEYGLKMRKTSHYTSILNIHAYSCTGRKINILHWSITPNHHLLLIYFWYEKYWKIKLNSKLLLLSQKSPNTQQF